MPAPSCNRCGATLKFVRMAATGRSLPVNAVPDPSGSIAARWTGERWAGGYTLRSGEAPKPGFKVFRAHFADCKTEPKKTRSEAASAALFS